MGQRANTIGFQSTSIKRHLRNLKKTSAWRVSVISLSLVFRLLWDMLSSPQRKVTYLLSKYRGKGRKGLNCHSIELLNNEKYYIEFANWLRGRIPQKLIEASRNQMLASSEAGTFTNELENSLSEETRLGILQFALSEQCLQVILPYCGTVPRLYSAIVMHNISKPGSTPAGSQLWHRDGDGFRFLKLFLCLSEVDDESGPFYAIGTNAIPFHAAVPLEPNRKANSLWEGGRHTDEYMRRFVANHFISKLSGPIGTAAWVDTAACYHKGGFCKSKDRLLLQITYVTDLSHPIPSILDRLNLVNHPEAKKLVDSPVRRLLCSEKTRAFYIKDGKRWLDTPGFFLARRLLTYDLTASS